MGLKTPNTADTGAVFSDCDTYRYLLWHEWAPEKSAVAFVGLNPSCARVQDTNPTFKRCVNYAKYWGFGRIYLVNLFAYRASTPQQLRQAKHPVGTDNDKTLVEIARQSELVVAAWGNDGQYLQRSAQVRALLPRLHVLKVNRTGEPAHPLYLKASLKPYAWNFNDVYAKE